MNTMQSSCTNRKRPCARPLLVSLLSARLRAAILAGSVMAVFMFGLGTAQALYPNIEIATGNTFADTDWDTAVGGYSWMVDGTEHLNHSSLWFGLGAGQDKLPLHMLTLGSLVADATSVQGRYQHDQFAVTVRYAVTGGLFGQSSLAQQITVENLTAAPLTLSLFLYSDYNVDEERDANQQVVAAGVPTQYGSVSRVTTTPSVAATSYTIGTPEQLLGILNDAATYTLDNNGGLMEGDMASLLHWDLTIPASGTVLISVQNQIEDVIVQGLPRAPTQLTATETTPEQVNLNWADHADNETGFRIERAAGNGSAFAAIATVGVDVTSYVDTTAQGNAGYRYRVFAFNAAGDSPPTFPATVQLTSALPGAPTQLSATLQVATAVTVQQVNLAWTDNASSETGFRIERSTWPATTFVPLTTVAANATSYSDTAVQPHTGYRYRVVAYNAAGDSLSSDEAAVQTRSSAPIAAMTGLADGAVLSSSRVTLTWSAGTGAEAYAMWIGSSAGAYDLYAAFENGTSRTVAVPTDGRTIYVTLWTRMNGQWEANTYSYTTANVAGPVLPAMLTPAPGSTLTSSSATFTWDGGVGASAYAMWVGSAPNGYDIHAAVHSDLTATVTNLPTDGRTIYVVLWSWMNGTWQSRAYTYTAFTATGPDPAKLVLPLAGSTLTSDRLTLVWDAGVGATQYALWVGDAPQAYNLYAAFESGLSRTVQVPLTGNPVYVRLWSLINDVWQFNDYTFTTPSPVAAQMTSPVGGTVLPGANVTFTWNAGRGATRYAMWIGSNNPDTHDLYAAFESGLSRAVTLPADGRTIHVKLWSLINGAWQANSYSYTAAAAP
ncbi:MAG: fibronectin type III domain-containing protein [Verrucomicrobia bacterium]|nr:fibronectin type III domain-containing protein [Verrucomicrobiota bacterium]